MSASAVIFLAIGAFAVLLLVLSLVGGHLHVGHLHIGHLHIGHLHVGHLHAGGAGHAGGGGQGGAESGTGGGFELSLPVIAGFLGAFGFAGAIAIGLGAGVPLAIPVGVVAAVPAAMLAGRALDAAVNMPTDATLTSNDLVGALGVVITPVPVDGYGEVRLAVAGQQIKFNARSDRPLGLGTRIFVIEVPTPTSVLVEPVPEIA